MHPSPPRKPSSEAPGSSVMMQTSQYIQQAQSQPRATVQAEWSAPSGPSILQLSRVGHEAAW